MSNKIKEFISDALSEIGYGIRYLCGKPTPLKRFIIVLVISGILACAFLFTLVSAIYNIGRNDGQQMKIEHIKTLELKQSGDNINHYNYKKYEK